MEENLDIIDGPSWLLANEQIITYRIGQGSDLILVGTFARTIRTGRIFRRSRDEFLHIAFPLKVGDWVAGGTMTNFVESLAGELFSDPASNAICNRWNKEYGDAEGYLAHPLLAITDEPAVIGQQIIIDDESGEVTNHLVHHGAANLGVIDWHNFPISDIRERIEGPTSCLLLSDEESAEYADHVDPTWRDREKALRDERDELLRLFIERFGIE